MRILTPREYHDTFDTISPAALKARGVKAVLCDVDNTLVPWNDHGVPATLRQWLDSLRSQGLLVCLVSNNNGPRVKALAEELHLPYVAGAMKPRRRGFREAMVRLGVQPHETVMVGDQIFTDTLGANRSGIHTILVRPISTKEFVLTRVVRKVEALWLRRLRRRGVLPPR